MGRLSRSNNQFLKPLFYIISVRFDHKTSASSRLFFPLQWWNSRGLDLLTCRLGITGFTFKAIVLKLSLHLSGGWTMSGTQLTENHNHIKTLQTADLIYLYSPGESWFLASVRAIISLFQSLWAETQHSDGNNSPVWLKSDSSRPHILPFSLCCLIICTFSCLESSNSESAGLVRVGPWLCVGVCSAS